MRCCDVGGGEIDCERNAQTASSIPPACHMMIMALIFIANEQTSLELNAHLNDLYFLFWATYSTNPGEKKNIWRTHTNRLTQLILPLIIEFGLYRKKASAVKGAQSSQVKIVR